MENQTNEYHFDIEKDVNWLPKHIFEKNGEFKAVLIPYIDRHIAVRVMNQLYGAVNWKEEYHTDKDGYFFCKISVYNPTVQEWVSKLDVGEEANNNFLSPTDKMKSKISDAFKRAVGKWGVSVEDAGNMIISLKANEVKKENDGKCSLKYKALISTFSFKKDIEGNLTVFDSWGEQRNNKPKRQESNSQPNSNRVSSNTQNTTSNQSFTDNLPDTKKELEWLNKYKPRNSSNVNPEWTEVVRRVTIAGETIEAIKKDYRINDKLKAELETICKTVSAAKPKKQKPTLTHDDIKEAVKMEAKGGTVDEIRGYLNKFSVSDEMKVYIEENHTNWTVNK